jgi:hypothetical protein
MERSFGKLALLQSFRRKLDAKAAMFLKFFLVEEGTFVHQQALC